MTRTITAHFDGKFIVPDEPVDLVAGQTITLHIEAQKAESPKFAGLLKFGVDSPDSPGDLAEQHDHYLYGHPKR